MPKRYMAFSTSWNQVCADACYVLLGATKIWTTSTYYRTSTSVNEPSGIELVGAKAGQQISYSLWQRWLTEKGMILSRMFGLIFSKPFLKIAAQLRLWGFRL